MNTKNLETLMTIIETGSFQKAATRLDYTPSAVTSQIKQLEKELSIKLFEKIGRRMELTQAGKDILPFIEAILNNVEQLNNYKKDISEITGTLRLVAPDSIFIYTMQPIIKAILHTAPKINLIVNSLPSYEINQRKKFSPRRRSSSGADFLPGQKSCRASSGTPPKAGGRRK